MKLNVLVFPCGSEIGLEVYRALRYSSHVNLIGGSSVDDHGRFLYSNYVGGIPFLNEDKFIEAIRQIVADHKIDLIYPAMDSVVAALKEHEETLCPVVGPPLSTAKICLSKRRTYERLKDVVNVPVVYEELTKVDDYPVFGKPDIGYGSRGAVKIESGSQLTAYKQMYPDGLILEYLPGKEYTIDCFTDRHGVLLFAAPRCRTRISNGISVRTSAMEVFDPAFTDMAQKINQKMELRGAWFFQVKEAVGGSYKLMEVAARIGGSSSVHRIQGVNLPLLCIFDAIGKDVEIIRNGFSVQLDRALNSKYKLELSFDTVYVDFDDTLVINGLLNTALLGLLYGFVQEGKKIILVTKHDGDINARLETLRILELFDEIIHLDKGDDKVNYLNGGNAIFIDDSFQERSRVYEQKGIPVFAPDAMEGFGI